MNKPLIIKISSFALLIFNVYLIFSDPLEKIYSYPKMVLAWAVLMAINNYLLRKNKRYIEVRHIIIQACFTLFYLLFPS